MFSPCSVNFIVAADFPELISARIERIDNALKDITFQRQTDFLLINGWITRHITYRKQGGGFQELSGSFPFQTSIRTDNPDELPLFEIQLTQQSFTLQPRTGGLEQTFLLMLREKETGHNRTGKKWVSVTARQIVESGDQSALGRVEVELPDNGCEPVHFTGGIRFSDQQWDWLNGVLHGTLRCRNIDGTLSEYPLQKEIDFIDSMRPYHQAHQELNLKGAIASHMFFKPSNRSCWILTVKIDYHWDITESVNTRCMTASDENPTGGIVMRSDKEIAICNQQLSQNLELPVMLKPTEIQCTIRNLRENQSRNGFILTAEYDVELYGIDRENQETYSVFRQELIEWIPTPIEIKGLKHLHFNSRLLAVIGPFSSDTRGASLTIFFDYEGRIMQKEFYRVGISREEKGTDFLVKSLQHRREFFIAGEENIDLCREDVAKMDDISVELSDCRGTPQKGWLKVDGLLAVSVSYIGADKEYRCKIINIPVLNVLGWDEIDDDFEVLCYGTAESNMIMQLESVYRFSFFLRLECFALKNERVKLSLFSDEKPKNKTGDVTGAQTEPPQMFQTGRYDIRLDEILPFAKSAPVEITEKNLVLTDIFCSRIGERLLITGIQEWSLHFRNQSDVYETQKYKIPFWRYLPAASFSVDNRKAIRTSHRILEYDVSLLKKRVFAPRTGQLTVRFELSFPEDDSG